MHARQHEYRSYSPRGRVRPHSAIVRPSPLLPLYSSATAARPRPPHPHSALSHLTTRDRQRRHNQHHSSLPAVLRRHTALPPLHHARHSNTTSRPAGPRHPPLLLFYSSRTLYRPSPTPQAISGSPLPRIPIPCRFGPDPRQGPRSSSCPLPLPPAPCRLHHKQPVDVGPSLAQPEEEVQHIPHLDPSTLHIDSLHRHHHLTLTACCQPRFFPTTLPPRDKLRLSRPLTPSTQRHWSVCLRRPLAGSSRAEQT